MCRGCKEVERLISVYSCNNLHDVLCSLNNNLKKAGRMHMNMFSYKKIRKKKERLWKNLVGLFLKI